MKEGRGAVKKQLRALKGLPSFLVYGLLVGLLLVVEHDVVLVIFLFLLLLVHCLTHALFLLFVAVAVALVVTLL